MLAAFGFEAMGVVVGDMYFVDPNPLEGQDISERGVRVELRLVDRDEPQGSITPASRFRSPVRCGGWTFSGPPRARPERLTAPITTPASTGGNPDGGTSSPSCRPTRWPGWPRQLADPAAVLERAGVNR